MAVIFRDKFWPKFQQEFSRKFQQEFLPKFQNFGSNLNKIFYKILVNLNILPIIFAVVLLSLLRYYNKNPVRNLVLISAKVLLYFFAQEISHFGFEDGSLFLIVIAYLLLSFFEKERERGQHNM